MCPFAQCTTALPRACQPVGGSPRCHGTAGHASTAARPLPTHQACLPTLLQGSRFEEWCQEQQLAAGGKICGWETAQRWQLPQFQYFPPGASSPRTAGAPVRQPAAVAAAAAAASAGWSGSESDSLGTAEGEAAAAGQWCAAPPQRRGQPSPAHPRQQQQPAQRRIDDIPAAEQPGWRPPPPHQGSQRQEEPLSIAAQQEWEEQQGWEEQRQQQPQSRGRQPERQPFWVPEAESEEEQPCSSEEPCPSEEIFSPQPLPEQQAGRPHLPVQPHWQEPPAQRHGQQLEGQRQHAQRQGQPQERPQQRLERPAGHPQLPGAALAAEWQRPRPQQPQLRRASAPKQQEPAWDEQWQGEWQQPARPQRQTQPERLAGVESQALEQQLWWEGDDEEEAAQPDQWGRWPPQGQLQQPGQRQPALQLRPSDNEQSLPRLAAVATHLRQAEAGEGAGAVAAAAAAVGAQAAGARRRRKGHEGDDVQRAGKHHRLASAEPAAPAAHAGQQPVKSVSRQRAAELSVVRPLPEQEIVPPADRPKKPAAGTICPMCSAPVAESGLFRWCSVFPYGNQYVCQACSHALRERCMRVLNSSRRKCSDWRGPQRRRRARRQLAAAVQQELQQQEQQEQQQKWQQ